ncbi:glycogen synthase kinase binding protein [Pristis pectinata]|uniref:glycogen synthase kinase binding protein n=1 Tax=Pristis pectinata TaxID=685728 RepID=UPI00223E0D29|nr:glycogen synthase kinase binding protein [Pristis pectinata]
MCAAGARRHSSGSRYRRRRRRRRHTAGRGEERMPRRGESFLLLEQAVTVDPNEIDALVAKIGETLRFQRMPGGGGTGEPPPRSPPQPPPPPRGPAKCGVCCTDRLKAPSRNKPYQVPARLREPGPAAAAHGRSKAGRQAAACEVSAQQRLEQLLSSGNLIKEAVRRLRIDRHCPPLYLEKMPL